MRRLSSENWRSKYNPLKAPTLSRSAALKLFVQDQAPKWRLAGENFDLAQKRTF
jgi:hypothetical protein